ncbi:uncharacterized protein LOC127726569 isoform X3 [Mytilus californianus]|uniref:uncharacterized protein LOC127726569 isoform X3 n=1 Tax=Mytilus californianus TaxID=6549 RepID=UPI002245C8B5|nr:uncharacterized protein LOC127726569 isoform X3 [Mytilus californianus]
MLAGAYSKTFRQIEQQQVEHLKQMAVNGEDDALSRAKKLQNETNRRRKAQAVKRKLEAQREEKRRQNILNKRSEEQRQATEKFQRSHISSRPSSKNSNSSHSGKRSPKFTQRTLEDTLKLVRGSSSGRHSAKHQTSPYSTQLFSTDPLNKPYVNKYSGSYHHTPEKQNDNSNANYLHNNSLRNLNSSRNLFEQQLEQHQQLLVEQQQRTLNEFNDAIKNEIASDRSVQGVDVEYGHQNLPQSQSLDSLDSLEDSEDSIRQNRDLTYNQNQSEANRDQEFINRYSTKNDLSYINGHQAVGRSPVNIVVPQINCQNIQNQLESDQYENSKNDRFSGYQANGRIDSYDVSQNGVNNVIKAKTAADRPKVQLRAWATPSPVDSSHRQPQQEIVSQNSQRMATNASLYTQRNTMTTVTTTTAYARGTSNAGQQYAQSNINTNGEPDTSIMTNGPGLPHPQVMVFKKQNEGRTTQPSKNMEFLETVTNGFGSDRSDLYENNINGKIQREPSSGSNTTVPKEPPPSRVPRPVTVVKKVIPSKQIAVPSAPSMTPPSTINQTIVNAKTTSTPVSQPIVVLSVSKVDNKENKPKQTNQINENTPKLQLLPGGKLTVLPDKPVMPVRQAVGQPQQATAKQVSYAPPQKSKDDSELETVSKAKLKEMESGVVKSILKRPATCKLPTSGTIKRAGSTGSMNIKDSLEVAKSQMLQEKDKQTKPKKKSVRFAGVEYSDGVEEETEEEEDKLFTKRISVKITPKKRPFSAKPNLQTTETETTHKSQGRVGSASVLSQKHKSTIRPQAAAHIITHNTLKENSQPEKRTSVVNNNFMSKVPVSSVAKSLVSQFQPVSSEITMYTVPGARLNYAVSATNYPVSSTVVSSQKHEVTPNGYYQQPMMSGSTPAQGLTNGIYQEGPVYDENGMRIDRTPTDDEINFLWDKVRTCLHRTPAPANSPTSDPVKPPFFDQPVSRQAAHVSHTIIDGAALGQIANQTRVSSYNTTNPTTSGRKSVDPNGYQRRYGLLQRQKQQNPNSLGKNNQQQREMITYHSPMSSNQEPQQGNPQFQPRQDTADSMTAFLMAEQLAQQSMSESQIHHAMNDVQSNPVSANRPAPNVPSALSIEERRLLESLDKLNEQLKISEFPGPLPQQAPPPQPVQQTVPHHYVHPPNYSTAYTMYNLNTNAGGFRGHHPIQHKRNSAGQRKMSPTIQNFRFS